MVFVYYYYTPSIAAAGIFTVLFGICTILHFYQLVWTRTWFMIPFLIGGIMETTGYIGRMLSSKQAPDFTLGPYVIQSCLLLIAPAFFAASIYMTLGRVIRMVHGQAHSPIRVGLLTKLFVAGDLLSFLMQASGAGLMVTASGFQTGSHVVDGGLIAQILFFGLFLVTSVIFDLRMNRSAEKPTSELYRVWRRQMVGLYVCSLLIFARSIVRLVEYLEGFQGYVMTHEVFIYIFDALLMFLVMIVMNFMHPSQVNCWIGKGVSYFEQPIVRRKFAPDSTMEMSPEASVHPR